MAKATELKRGDACPNCRGELKPAYVPTDEELERSLDRDNPIPLPVGADSASKAQREDLGELHRCGTCGYVTRFPAQRSDTRGGGTSTTRTAGRGGDTSSPAPSGGTTSGRLIDTRTETATASGSMDSGEWERFQEWQRSQGGGGGSPQR